MGARKRPSRSYLVLDVETVLDPLLPTRTSDGFPPAPYHQVVALGVCWFDEAHELRRFGIVGEGKDEESVLGDFVRFYQEYRPDLVTWNGRSFEMPVVVARCLKYGIAFPAYYGSRELRYRFTTEGHFDLMDYLSDFGASRPAPLDAVAQLIGLPGKRGVEGRDVGPLVHRGKLADVYAYCLSDVIQTAALFLRVQLVRGVLDRAAYRRATEALLREAGADARLAPVVNAVDRPRLLLGDTPDVPAPAEADAKAEGGGGDEGDEGDEEDEGAGAEGDEGDDEEG
jgi:3'-5' exonuclease